MKDVNYGIADISDKEKWAKRLINYQLDRTNHIFKYDGLPDTIPEYMMELMLQCYGFVIFAKVKGSYYVFNGGLGGEPDVYYRPTVATIANPALNYSANLKIGEECVIVRNDTQMMGVMPYNRLYAMLIMESFVTMRMAEVNVRTPYILTASDDSTKASLDVFLKKVERGELGYIADKQLIDTIKMLSAERSSNNYLSQLIELHQYLLTKWESEFGVDGNFNMKREHINVAESEMGAESLVPLVSDMYECRKAGIEEINKLFGLDIKVTLTRMWKQHEDESQIDIEEEREEEKEMMENGEMEEESGKSEPERDEENDRNSSNT